MIRFHGAKGNVASTNETVELEDRFDVLVDANDQLLERIVSIYRWCHAKNLFLTEW